MLSRIPWENATFYSEVDYNVVKAVVNKGEMNTSGMIEPELVFDGPKIYMKQLVSKLAGIMTKAQWKTEQQEDPEIGPVMQLVLANKHLQYKFQKDDNPGSKIILHFRDNLKLVDDIENEFTKVKLHICNLYFPANFINVRLSPAMTNLVTWEWTKL